MSIVSRADESSTENNENESKQCIPIHTGKGGKGSQWFALVVVSTFFYKLYWLFSVSFLFHKSHNINIFLECSGFTMITIRYKERTGNEEKICGLVVCVCVCIYTQYDDNYQCVLFVQLNVALGSNKKNCNKKQEE